MSVSVQKDAFNGKDEALATIRASKLHARDGAMAAGDLEDVHWHKTSLEIFVLSGLFETRDEQTGQLLHAGAGDLIRIPARTLHAARCPQPATYVVGFESEQAMQNFRPEKPEDLRA